MKLAGGSASVSLARGIGRELGAVHVDVAFAKHPGGFPDGERYVRLLGPVAGEHVVLVPTTHPHPMIVGFFFFGGAIPGAGGRGLFAVVPSFGGGPQGKGILVGGGGVARERAEHNPGGRAPTTS